MGIVNHSMFRFYVHYKNNIAKNEAPDPCADPENFVRGGSNSDNVFLYFGVQKEDPNTTKIGPSLAHRRNVI